MLEGSRFGRKQTVGLKNNHLNLKAFRLPDGRVWRGTVESILRWNGREKRFGAEIRVASR
jgi:hypothetical protein